MNLLFKDAVRFLEQKSPKAACPFCGSDKWIVPFADADKEMAFLMPLNAKFNSETAYNLELECNNCGFIRSHRARVIAEWLAKNPAEDSK